MADHLKRSPVGRNEVYSCVLSKDDISFLLGGSQLFLPFRNSLKLEKHHELAHRILCVSIEQREFLRLSHYQVPLVIPLTRNFQPWFITRVVVRFGVVLCRGREKKNLSAILPCAASHHFPRFHR